MKIRSAIALCAVAASVGGCATKSDMADLQATLVVRGNAYWLEDVVVSRSTGSDSLQEQMAAIRARC